MRARGLLCGLLLLVSFPISAALLSGKAVSVADGDTLTVLDDAKTQHRVRLAGIDAPERKQPFGTASRKHLADLVAGQQVRIEWTKRDRYGRIVGKVVLPKDGRDVCLKQVSAGLAWHYKKYQGEQTAEDRRLYAEAEERARQAQLGLWRDKGQTPPWQWRRSVRTAKH